MLDQGVRSVRSRRSCALTRVTLGADVCAGWSFFEISKSVTLSRSEGRRCTVGRVRTAQPSSVVLASDYVIVAVHVRSTRCDGLLGPSPLHIYVLVCGVTVGRTEGLPVVLLLVTVSRLPFNRLQIGATISM